MRLQWLGVVLVVAGSGGFGFSLAAACRRDMMLLDQLIRILNDMEWELQYRLTPLPELCRTTGQGTKGILRDFFLELAGKLQGMAHPDADSCIRAILDKRRFPDRIRKYLLQLGRTLGRYDLQGQVLGLRSVRTACQKELRELEQNRTERLRGYQTLALCAGAAVAILLI